MRSIMASVVSAALSIAAGSAAAEPTLPANRQVGMVDLEAKQKEAMRHFEPQWGIWRGSTVETRPDGSKVRTLGAHRVGPMLGGETMMLEGRSYNEDGTTAFNLMAVISFDPTIGEYAFRAYGRGRIVTAVLHVTPTGYWFERPDFGGSTARYTVTFVGGRWHEHGERLVPGSAPVTVLETDLTRVGDTDWPSANAVAFVKP